MPRNISDVRESAHLFLDEADICANHSPKVLGFAAMTTTLSCVIAFGEALIGRANIKENMKAFCSNMTNYDWLLNDQGQTKAYDVLTDVRNGLSHVLSLPGKVWLVRTKEDFKATGEHKDQIGIVPSLFVRSVRETIDNIVQKSPGLVFDLLKNRNLVIVTGTGSKAG